nr:MAG TPA: hypothetical protein [Caudoviricetes sp.]
MVVSNARAFGISFIDSRLRPLYGGEKGFGSFIMLLPQSCIRFDTGHRR